MIYTLQISELHFVSGLYTFSYHSYTILQRTIYKLGVSLPVALPLGNTAAELEQYQDDWAGKISYMFTKANAGENI